MREFILNLYSNEGFPIYLGFVIVVLIIAFITIFIIGKKDGNKNENIRKLEKVKENPVNNKVQVQNENINVNNNAQTPLTNEPLKKEENLKILNFDKKEEEKELVNSNEIAFPKAPSYGANETLDKTQTIPIFDAYDNDNPKSIENQLLDGISSDLDELEKDLYEDNSKEEIDLPKRKDKKTKVIDVYSSVYVNKEDKDSEFDKTMAIVLPREKGKATLDEKGEDPLNL